MNLPVDEDGLHRSQVFPGLWLDASAVIAGDMARVLRTLQEGLQSDEHQTFVDHLQRNNS